MNDLISVFKPDFQKTIEHLRTELTSIRTGRASAALVENIQIEAYGSNMSVKGVAGIGVPDAKTITVDPWDKSLIKNIEKGIRDAGVGLNPVNEGTLLRIVIPQLSEENRRELAKVIGEKVEEARERVRGTREECKETIILAERDKEIAEDERYKLTDELEKLVGQYNDELKKIGEDKEKEIMTI
jgi:ribosome recycling factor